MARVAWRATSPEGDEVCPNLPLEGFSGGKSITGVLQELLQELLSIRKMPAAQGVGALAHRPDPLPP